MADIMHQTVTFACEWVVNEVDVWYWIQHQEDLNIVYKIQADFVHLLALGF